MAQPVVMTPTATIKWLKGEIALLGTVQTPSTCNPWTADRVPTVLKAKLTVMRLQGVDNDNIVKLFPKKQLNKAMMRRMTSDAKRGRLKRSKAGAPKGAGDDKRSPSVGCDSFLSVVTEDSLAAAPGAAPALVEEAPLVGEEDLRRLDRSDDRRLLLGMQKDARRTGNTVPASMTSIVPGTFIQVKDEQVSLLRFFARKCVTPLTLFPFLAEGSVARTCACH
jgi:hypothetical protein